MGEVFGQAVVPRKLKTQNQLWPRTRQTKRYTKAKTRRWNGAGLLTLETNSASCKKWVEVAVVDQTTSFLEPLTLSAWLPTTSGYTIRVSKLLYRLEGAPMASRAFG